MIIKKILMKKHVFLSLNKRISQPSLKYKVIENIFLYIIYLFHTKCIIDKSRSIFRFMKGNLSCLFYYIIEHLRHSFAFELRTLSQMYFFNCSICLFITLNHLESRFIQDKADITMKNSKYNNFHKNYKT